MLFISAKVTPPSASLLAFTQDHIQSHHPPTRETFRVNCVVFSAFLADGRGDSVSHLILPRYLMPLASSIPLCYGFAKSQAGNLCVWLCSVPLPNHASVVRHNLTTISFEPSHSLTGSHLGFRPPLTAVICYLNRAIIYKHETLLPPIRRESLIKAG